MIKKYNTIYPFNIYVATFSDWNKAEKKFIFFQTLNDLYNKIIYTDRYAEKPVSSAGCVYLVREANDDSNYGALLLLNEEYFFESISEIVNTITHESVHVADYIWMHINGGYTEDRVNEPYAYLVGWIAGVVSDYVVKYKESLVKHGSEEI